MHLSICQIHVFSYVVYMQPSTTHLYAVHVLFSGHSRHVVHAMLC